MAATDQTATLGAFPPARAQGGGAPRWCCSGAYAAELTGATYRQIDWWARHNLLGEHQRDIGSGGRRSFVDEDLEVIRALAHLALLGCKGPRLAESAAEVRRRRVAPGEWLLVSALGTATRCGSPLVSRGPCWLIPLQAFDQGRPL